jgi:hypothetical protein
MDPRQYELIKEYTAKKLADQQAAEQAESQPVETA